MKYVYLIERNGDMTEGRGPWVKDSIFEEFRPAEKYVLSQKGIMGMKVYRHEVYDIFPNMFSYGAWKITKVELK